MSLGQLGVELYASSSRLESDMGRAAQIVESRARAMDQAAIKARKSLESIGDVRIGRINGAREAANEMEHLSHTTVGARREMLVLAHELVTGNYKRAVGSFMVLGERMDWMSKIAPILSAAMSPVGIALGVVAGAAIAVAVAYHQAAEESRKFQQSLELTGHAAGITQGQFNAIAQRAATASGVSVKEAREMEQAFVHSGRFSGEALEKVTLLAAKMSAVTGEKAEEIVKDMTRMTEGVTKYALEANKQYHFLDAAMYEHIKKLEEEGRAEDAESLVLDALDRKYGNTTKSVGFLTGAINLLSNAWNSFKNAVGGGTTIDDRIAQIQSQIDALPKSGSITGGAHPSDARARLEAALNAAVKEKMRQDDNELLEQQKTAQKDREVAAAEHIDKLRKETQTRAELRQKEIEQYKKDAATLHLSAEQQAKDIAAINEKYKDRGAASGARADLGAALKPLEDQITAEDKLLSQRQQVLARYYRDNKISAEGYYGDQRIIIEAHIARVSTLYDQEIATLNRYANSAKDHATKVEALTRAHELADKKEQAIAADREKLTLTTEGLARDTETYREQVEKLTAELAKLEGHSATTAGAEFDRQHKALLDKAAASGDTATQAEAARMREIIVNQQTIDNLKEKDHELDAERQIQVDRINILVKTGQESELQGMYEKDELTRKQVITNQTMVDQMRALPNLTDQQALAIKELQNRNDDLAASSNTLGKTFTDIFASSFARGINEAVSGTKTLKQAFLDMANSIEQAITQIVSKDLANQLFGNLTGGTSGGGIVGLIAKLFGNAGATGSENVGAAATSTPDDLISGYGGASKAAAQASNTEAQLASTTAITASTTAQTACSASITALAAAADAAASAMANAAAAAASAGGGGGGGMGGLGGLFGSSGATGSEAAGAAATSTPDDLIASYGAAAMAAGGPVGAGSMYEVNERAPELLTVANRTYLMMGQDSGRVTPMGDSESYGSQNVFNMNIAVPPGTTRQSAQQQGAEIMRHAQIAMARNS